MIQPKLVLGSGHLDTVGFTVKWLLNTKNERWPPYLWPPSVFWGTIRENHYRIKIFVRRLGDELAFMYSIHSSYRIHTPHFPLSIHCLPISSPSHLYPYESIVPFVRILPISFCFMDESMHMHCSL